jgi:pimeloyl-ACP methyl ester carboxylesterase
MGAMRLPRVIKNSGPDVVLVHGRASNSGTWKAQLPHLTDYRVTLVDLAGHGVAESPDDPAAFTVEAQVSHLAETLADIERPFVMVGHSLGGFLALRFALEYPGRLAGLVLESTASDNPYRGGRHAERTAEVSRLCELAEAEGMAAVCAHIESHEPLHERQRENLMSQTPLAYVATAQAIRDMPALSPRLHEVSLPTLVICGLDDEIFLPECRSLVEGIPGARGVFIPRCGHSPHRERPAEVAAPLQDFLAEVFAGGVRRGGLGG